MFKVPEKHRVTRGTYKSDSSIGNNGLFQFRLGKVHCRCIVSQDMGWEHVSITLSAKRTPNWKEMCKIKDLFWDESDTVIQYHPSKEDYVNCHPHCLHLWRPMDKELPKPPSFMVGPT